MKFLQRNAERIGSLLITAAFVLTATVLIFGPPTSLLSAQSTRRGGADVPVTPFEQWFKRIGFLNTTGGCDGALEFDSLNTLHVTDCTDAANLMDLRVRGIQTNGIPTSQGAAGSDTDFTKLVTAIANNVATTVATIAIPNAAGAATIGVSLTCSLGAGGAVGAYEETLTAFGQIVVTRTSGVNAVGTATALTNTGKANVAGADSTATLAYALASVVGAVGAANTLPIQVTVARGGGSSTNHTCLVSGSIMNAVGGGNGITIS